MQVILQIPGILKYAHSKTAQCNRTVRAIPLQQGAMSIPPDAWRVGEEEGAQAEADKALSSHRWWSA